MILVAVFVKQRERIEYIKKATIFWGMRPRGRRMGAEAEASPSTHCAAAQDEGHLPWGVEQPLRNEETDLASGEEHREWGEEAHFPWDEQEDSALVLVELAH